jgi:hypothetical protein
MKVTMRWKEIPLNIIGELEQGRMQVDPLKLAKVFMPLKREVLNYIDARKSMNITNEEKEEPYQETLEIPDEQKAN